MSDISIGLTGLLILFLLIGLRVSIGIALILVSFCGIWALLGPQVAWGALTVVPYQFTANWLLSSVPMFLLMGFVCYHGHLTKGLFHAAKVWLTALPGGLAIASVLGASGFAAVCGSSVACSAAMGRIAIPEMMSHRYSPELASGTVAVAGTIGALIPPSLLLILFGLIAEASVTRLFLGGVAVGLMSATAYILVILIRVWLDPSLAPAMQERPSWRDRFDALRDVWPVVLISVGIFSGLFGGFFTPTEAGAVGAFLSLVVAVMKGSLGLRGFRQAVAETINTTAMMILIGVGASLLTRFLALSGSSEYLASAILSFGADPMLLLLGIVLLYLVIGMFLEPVSALLLTMPVVLPLVREANWDIIWFGILLAKLLEIGMVTPPIGMNVFVIKSVVGKLIPLGTIFRGVAWFMVADLLVVLMLCIWPAIILFLPNYLGR